MDSWAMGIGDELGMEGFGGNCQTEIRKLRFSFQFPMETVEPKGKDRQLDTLSSTRPVSRQFHTLTKGDAQTAAELQRPGKNLATNPGP